MRTLGMGGGEFLFYFISFVCFLSSPRPPPPTLPFLNPPTFFPPKKTSQTLNHNHSILTQLPFPPSPLETPQKKTGIGSVSKYCLSHSPVPVIVVRPERKVRKAMAKRRKDPKRGRHFEEE